MKAATTAEPRGREQAGRRSRKPPSLPFEAATAACHGYPDLMFPDVLHPWGNPLRPRGPGTPGLPPEGYAEAVAVGIALCRTCPHLEACDKYALAAGSRLLPVGIYGARPPEERRRMENAKRRATKRSLTV